MKDKFTSFSASQVPTMNLKQFLNFIIERNYSYGKEDESVIFKSTEDEIFNLFKENNGELLHKYRKILLKYRSVSNASDEWQAVTKKTEGALRRF